MTSESTIARVANAAATSLAHPLRVNIGCGTSGAPGWYNVDNSPTIPLSRIPLLRKIPRIPAWPADVRRHDVTKGLPFRDQTIECIYSSHTFEHFTWQQSLSVARECFRVLKPGGVLRIVVPDLELLVRDYLGDPGPRASHVFLQRLSLSHSVFDFLHPGSNHSQMFDGKSLVHLLREAGFANPKLREFMQSDIPDISGIELEVRKRESLYVEAHR